MPHVTFVHGIGNKPPADELHRAWRGALATGADGLDFDALGVTSTMVYWADVLHAAPLPTPPPGVRMRPEAAGDVFPACDLPLTLDLAEVRFTAMLAAKFGGALLLGLSGGAGLLDLRLPDPWRRWLLENVLRDAHHYLYDVAHEPRPGTRYRVRSEIRDRFVRALTAVPSRPHLVIGHSLGSVIAYDCLLNRDDCPTIDAMISLGSPLGLSEVQDRLAPGYSRDDGYPAARLRKAWRNFADRFDPVCGLDVKLAGDYRRDGKRVVRDTIVDNREGNRHAIVRYLGQPAVRSAIRASLAP